MKRKAKVKTWYVLYKDDGRAVYGYRHAKEAMKELKKNQPYGDFYLDRQGKLPRSLVRSGAHDKRRKRVLKRR
jgi:hypothetical protein